ncbi:hypothetical protein EPI10_022686 [Gossypium australe]|uniref:Uncharacterized protein n=1 Tax=Gossypium australe TaxID=47621 RepID=A0A5B6VT18_9ROSI|nr:hypothetical protein EPI10_022686 [Gossypium australe]
MSVSVVSLSTSGNPASPYPLIYHNTSITLFSKSLLFICSSIHFVLSFDFPALESSSSKCQTLKLCTTRTETLISQSEAGRRGCLVYCHNSSANLTLFLSNSELTILTIVSF